MSLTWMNNGFICKDLYASFVLEKDSDYIDDEPFPPKRTQNRRKKLNKM